MLHLDYRDSRPIYAQIVDSCREQILAGIWRSGDQLPTVRELAGQLAINPNTIQRAYRQLEAEGYLLTVPGKGCFATMPQDASQARTRLLAEFDRAAQALLRAGMTPAELAARLTYEEDHHAGNE